MLSEKHITATWKRINLRWYFCFNCWYCCKVDTHNQVGDKLNIGLGTTKDEAFYDFVECNNLGDRM